jgi:hypothetical protein
VSQQICLLEAGVFRREQTLSWSTLKKGRPRRPASSQGASRRLQPEAAHRLSVGRFAFNIDLVTLDERWFPGAILPRGGMLPLFLVRHHPPFPRRPRSEDVAGAPWLVKRNKCPRRGLRQVEFMQAWKLFSCSCSARPRLEKCHARRRWLPRKCGHVMHEFVPMLHILGFDFRL